MASIETAAHDYLKWMAVHNYARTTIEGRRRHLGQFAAFAYSRQVEIVEAVTLDLLSRARIGCYHDPELHFLVATGSPNQRTE
ncbi:MAG TPA: hypothetical protein VMU76_09470 [Acidimicrobiales bacterium]|nr:hypothetical protein [Acidimicrobiales bacterium]